MSLEYMSPEVASEEAGRRLRDPVLQEKVRQYLGGVWPPGFEELTSPVAVFAPYLAKASETEVAFLNMAAESDFETIVATYTGTEYVTANAGLVDCYRAPLKLPKGQQQRLWVVPESERPGALGDAATIYGGLPITDYWQGIRTAVLEENALPTADKVVDFGAWYAYQARRFGWTGERSKSGFYYMASMALYTAGAVLCDVPAEEFDFRVLEPAYVAAKNQFGVAPLIADHFEPVKRDWTDVSFLDGGQIERLLSQGVIT